MDCWCWEAMVDTSIKKLHRSNVLNVSTESCVKKTALFLICPLVFLCDLQIIVKIAAGNGVGKILVGK